MSGTDVVLVALTVVCLAATAVLAVTVMQLRTVTTHLRDELAEFTAAAVPAAHDLSSSAQLAALQVDRLENLIDVADGATAATVRALSNPVIKTAAIARGTRKAARRLAAAERPIEKEA